MIDAWRQPARRYTLPTPQAGDLVAYGRIPATTIADASEHGLRLMTQVLTGQGTVEKHGPLMDHFNDPKAIPEDVIIGLCDIIRLGDQVQWATVDSGDTRKTRTRVTFAKNQPDE
jgi:hypothetical protein